MPDELTIRTYKFEVFAEPNEELGLPEVTLFKAFFGAASEQAAVEFVNEMFALWKDKNLLRSPVELTYKVNLESYVPNSN